MTVEAANFIAELDNSLPTASDPKSEGDNQLRLIKSVLKTQFPNFGTAAMTASHTELNYMVGVTSSVQTQLNARALKAGDTYTGAHNFTGASSVTAPTPTVGDSSTKVATTAFVAATAFTVALPGQTGNNGKLLNTNGSAAIWTDTITTSKTIEGDFTLSGTARRIYGDLSNITRGNRLLFSDSNSGVGFPTLGVVPRVSGSLGGAFEAYSDHDPDNSGLVRVFCNKFVGKSGISAERNGTGITQPFVVQIDGLDALQVDTNRNIRSVGGGAIGYGAGSGGTVTQLTSKSTAVTLNKPTGQITTHNAALAANTEVSFILNSTSIAVGDAVYVTGNAAANYQYRAGIGVAGGVSIFIRNITAGSLSDVLTIDFKVLKGSLT